MSGPLALLNMNHTAASSQITLTLQIPGSLVGEKTNL